MPTDQEPGSLEADEALVAAVVEAGTNGVTRQAAVRMLYAMAEGPVTLDQVIARTAVPKNTVGQFARLLGMLVAEDDGHLCLPPKVVEALHTCYPLPSGWTGREGFVEEPGSGQVDPSLLGYVRDVVARAPIAKPSLDHVPATPTTIARRALFFDWYFYLPQAAVAFVGDHDLTSLALRVVQPAAKLAVVDVDEDVLGYVRAEVGDDPNVRCLLADLRIGAPRSLKGQADLAFTDPPYTPEGVSLFVLRALQTLRNLETGRVVLAYGSGDQPGLALLVQEAMRDLRLVYEAVLPNFNRYRGAQAVGSASNLYVLRPTTGTRRLLGDGRTPRRLNIYSHGGQAIEARTEPVNEEQVALLRTLAAGEDTLPVRQVLGPRWPGELQPVAESLATILDPVRPEKLDPSVSRGAMIADLRDDPGAVLLRLLLASTARRVIVLVRSSHPDVATREARAALGAAIGVKYALRVRHDPVLGPHLMVVEARLVSTEQFSVASLVRRSVLDHPYAKVANALREAVMTSSRHGGVTRLTKNQARNAVGPLLERFDAEATVLELPRATLGHLLEQVGDLAGELLAPPSPGSGIRAIN